MRGNMNMDVGPYAPVNVNPRTPPGRDTAGHYWGISCDLTKKTSAHIGVFYIFCSAYIHRGKGPELFPLTENRPEMSLAHILGYSTAG